MPPIPMSDPDGDAAHAPALHLRPELRRRRSARDRYTLQIVDTATNAETDMHSVVTCPTALAPTGCSPRSCWTPAAASFWRRGPFDQLTTAELTVGLLAFINWAGYPIDAMGPELPTNVTVLVAPVTAPDQEEIDTIDLATFDVTVDVPAIPASVAWATGATPAVSLQSTTVAGLTRQLIDGHYIYPRSMSDGGSTMFAGPFASGPASELALFEIPAGTPLPSASEVGFPAGSLRLRRGPCSPGSSTEGEARRAASSSGTTPIWLVTACPSVRGAVPRRRLVAGSIEGAVLGDAGFPGPPDNYNTGGLLDLLTLGGPGGDASCQQMAGNDAVAAAFSPDGDFMFWVIRSRQPASRSS